MKSAPHSATSQYPHKMSLLDFVFAGFLFLFFFFYEPKVIKFKIALRQFFQLRPPSLRTRREQDPAILFPLERTHKVSVSGCRKETVW